MISPLDSRYKSILTYVDSTLGHDAIIKSKFHVEASYLLYLCNLTKSEVPEGDLNELKAIMAGDIDMEQYYSIESSTKHDIAAMVEYVKKRLSSSRLKSLAHFGLTSEDVCSVANNYSFTKAMGVVNSHVANLTKLLHRQFYKHPVVHRMFFMGRTHGQPAMVTSMEREMGIYISRITQWLNQVEQVKATCKFSGAIGYPAGMNMIPGNDAGSSKFIRDTYGLDVNPNCTQTDNYPYICSYLSSMVLLSNYLIDLAHDCWLYANNGIISITKSKSQVGSSTMPQKSNPIAFENSMANLELFITNANHFINNMSRSMMQRDLRSSSLLRNLGSIVGYFVVGLNSLYKGISLVKFNHEYAMGEINQNYQALAEYVQLYLRLNCDVHDAHRVVMEEMGSARMTQMDYASAIVNISARLGDAVSDEAMEEMASMNPIKYFKHR